MKNLSFYNFAMKRALICFICSSLLILSSSFTYAQTWQWAIKDSGAGNDLSTAMCVDNAGNSYITGSFEYNTYFNACGTNSSSSRYFFIAKYNTSGSCIWVKTAGANPTGGASGVCITMDRSGNLLVTGTFSDSISFGSTHLVASLGFFVTKYDNNGNLKWVKGCSGSAGGIGTDKKRNVYIAAGGTGTLSSCTLTNNTQLVKLDSNGNCKWQVQVNNVTSNALQADSIGNTFVAGTYTGTVIFGTDTLHPKLGGGGFIARYDSSGNCIWAKADYAAPVAIGLDKWDNIYLAARSYDTIYFGCDTLRFPASPSSYFIAKFDSAGNCVWDKVISNNAACYALHTKPNGNCYIVCSYNSSASIGTCNASSGPAIFVAGFDSSGSCDWIQTAGFCEPNGIGCDNSGNCYISGGISQNTTFGSITLTNPSTQSILLAKLGAVTGTGHSHISSSSTFNVYPNPSAGGYNLDISPDLLNSQLTIYDVQGRTVFHAKIEQQNPQINIPALAKGMYYIQLITPQGESLEKTIVKQ